ncbi:MAG: argininosuccinate synthase [Candidatus Diapherotrites archaeon]|nr:argininosuccinate synthase [Candidatus Diapherotrites archaeon]
MEWFEKTKEGNSASYEADSPEKVLLLYSGGLDTSVLLKFIQEGYDAELFTLTVDLGQSINLEKIRAKALALGAKKAFVADAKKEFAEQHISKAVKANALYQGKYPLSTAIGRPLIAKLAVEIAKKEGIDTIAHGCTGKGNDQVRIEAGIISLAPKMKILAPVRDWNMARNKELEYAKAKGIPVAETKAKPYSTDENMWGKSSECGALEDTFTEPPENVFGFCTLPEKAPDKPEIVEIGFAEGIPVSLNGKELPLQELVMELNGIAGKHGVGIIDHMEDRVVGLKSREVYECPAATVIIEAHKDLEKMASTVHENQFKEIVDQKWAYLVYQGLWFDPLMDSLNAFIEAQNKKVCGAVKVKLYKGHALVVGRKSPFALYDKSLATYDIGHTFNQKASSGFIELWSLQSKMAMQLKKVK